MRIQVNQKIFATAVKGEFPGDRIFHIGDRVHITPGARDGDHSYHGKYVGCNGEVVRMSDVFMSADADQSVTIGVFIDGQPNPRSQYGCYWFRPDELINMEESKMLLLKPYKMAKVDIEGFGDQYVAHYEESLEEGNGVVIVSDGRYRCGVVVSADITNKSFDPTWQVVCKIDDDAYLDRCNRAERADQIKKELSRAAKEYHEIALFEMMAEKSPTIAELLKEYKEISNA